MDKMNSTPQRNVITAASKPSLPIHVRLHHDKTRERWVVLAPERLLEPDEAAISTLRLCDGETSVQDIALKLAEEYNASDQDILKDILSMLQDLADKNFIKL